MCQLFETILIRNKNIENIKFHNLRFNKSRKEIFKCSDILNLEKFINISHLDNQHYRCRVTYSSIIENIEFIPYVFHPIYTLQMVVCNEINYNYKFTDREIFSKLKQNCNSDDILIIKNGLVTDTSISNIIFKKNNIWYTPDSPLLFGTQREKLLRKKFIKAVKIKAEDILFFDTYSLINALRTFDTILEVDIKKINIIQ